MATVPRLYLAEVWLPCQQCANINTNLCCMQISSFVTSQNSKVSLWNRVYDTDMNDYLEACEFHHLQIEFSCLDSSVGDLSISKNPLAHYAQRARIISHSFAVSLQSVNYSYLVKFSFQPKNREDDANGDNSLLLLSSIMEMSLKSFRFVPGEKLVSELPQEPNAIDCVSSDSLDVLKSYKQILSQSNFTTYLEMVDSYCLQPSRKSSRQRWIFGISSNSSLVPLLIKEKIENFMKKIQVNWTKDYWIIQFWAPKMVENRCYLEALDQPYVAGCLSKGLASFRKKCTTHSYFVDAEAKEEELGPPGRVFRNGHPEITPDLFHYTTKEYPIRNYAMHCCTLSRGYFAFPMFEDEHNHKCVGVLEFVGFHHLDLKSIEKSLKVAKLCLTHTDLYQQAVNTKCRRKALTEVRDALKVICKTPQLFVANVWIHNGECATGINSNKSCMEFALSSRHIGIYQVQWIHVQTGKGMVGTVLASENKSCFCRKICEFSIVDQPLSHFEISKRCEVCFAICLQSSHTSELLYVMEFFLYQGPTTYRYLRSFLNFLLPIMKHELKSFKMASGKKLGDELVVEVIEFSDANKLDSSESEQTDMFPIRFKSVQYSQKEYSVAASDSKTRKTGLVLNLEVLEPHFGKKLKDVAQELGIGRSTIKRACRDYGIHRWPTKKQYKNNSSLLERESGRVLSDQQKTNTESTHRAVIVEEKAEKVIIKVKYEEDVIKFEFYLSLGVSKLFE